MIKTDDLYLKELVDLYTLKDIFYVIDVINSLIDKIKFVSRQSVVVISNFLLMSNKFNSEEDDVVTVVKTKKKEENYDMAFTFSDNNKKIEENVVENDASTEKMKNISKEIVIKNKDVIINNAFALADKQLKLKLQEKWSNVSDYLTDKHYSMVVGKWTDVKIEVVGGNYIIFTVMYESLVDGIYNNEKLSNDFVNNILDGKYNYVVITNDEWNNYKNQYINNLKIGIKYQVKELQECEEVVEKKEVTAIDKLLGIVGEEYIEYK